MALLLTETLPTLEKVNLLCSIYPATPSESPQGIRPRMGILWSNQLTHRIKPHPRWIPVLVYAAMSSLLEKVFHNSESWCPPLTMGLNTHSVSHLEPAASSNEILCTRALEWHSPFCVCSCYSRVGECVRTRKCHELIRMPTKGAHLFCKENSPGIGCSQNSGTWCSHSSTLALIIGCPVTESSL